VLVEHAAWSFVTSSGSLRSNRVGYFYFDYFTLYKFRSAFYYDNVAFHAVADYLIESGDTLALYFTNDLDDVSVKWTYYTTSHAREELLRQTHYTEPEERPAAPAGSLLVTYDLTNRFNTLQAAGWRIEKLISDVDNLPATVILRKLG
jgi:hypothetical protein